MKDTPPADLLACPAAPAGFPLDGAASIPADVRAPLIGVVTAYAALSSQLTRLIEWEAPGHCAAR